MHQDINKLNDIPISIFQLRTLIFAAASAVKISFLQKKKKKVIYLASLCGASRAKNTSFRVELFFPSQGQREKKLLEGGNCQGKRIKRESKDAQAAGVRRDEHINKGGSTSAGEKKANRLPIPAPRSGGAVFLRADLHQLYLALFLSLVTPRSIEDLSV